MSMEQDDKIRQYVLKKQQQRERAQHLRNQRRTNPPDNGMNGGGGGGGQGGHGKPHNSGSNSTNTGAYGGGRGGSSFGGQNRIIGDPFSSNSSMPPQQQQQQQQNENTDSNIRGHNPSQPMHGSVYNNNTANDPYDRHASSKFGSNAFGNNGGANDNYSRAPSHAPSQRGGYGAPSNFGGARGNNPHNDDYAEYAANNGAPQAAFPSNSGGNSRWGSPKHARADPRDTRDSRDMHDPAPYNQAAQQGYNAPNARIQGGYNSNNRGIDARSNAGGYNNNPAAPANRREPSHPAMSSHNEHPPIAAPANVIGASIDVQYATAGDVKKVVSMVDQLRGQMHALQYQIDNVKSENLTLKHQISSLETQLKQQQQQPQNSAPRRTNNYANNGAANRSQQPPQQQQNQAQQPRQQQQQQNQAPQRQQQQRFNAPKEESGRGMEIDQDARQRNQRNNGFQNANGNANGFQNKQFSSGNSFPSNNANFETTNAFPANARAPSGSAMNGAGQSAFPANGRNQNSYGQGDDDEDPPPLPPSSADDLIAKLEAQQDAFQAPPQLVKCHQCGRKFSQKALERHIKICKKVFGQKRKAFDAKRVDDEALKASRNTDTDRIEAELKRKREAAKVKWKAQSSMLRQAVKASKQIETALKEGKSLADIPNIPSTIPDTRTPCPHCGRKFADETAKRHIPKCQNMKSRPKALMRRR